MLHRGHQFPRVSRYKRRSDIMEVRVYEANDYGHDLDMLKHMCLIWLLILFIHLYLSGMWLGVAPRIGTKKTCV